MRIRHPFDPFVPGECRFLLLGSFPGKLSTSGEPDPEDWYYGATANQFWPIMRLLFPQRPLSDRSEKMALFSDMRMAVTDVILSCERKSGSNLDSNLVQRAYNTGAVGDILRNNNIRTVFFTGRGVMRTFTGHFTYSGDLALEVFPSPSPAFFRMSLADKAQVYRNMLEYHGVVQHC